MFSDADFYYHDVIVLLTSYPLINTFVMVQDHQWYLT